MVQYRSSFVTVRLENEFRLQFEAYMGNEFKVEPLLTKRELMDGVEFQTETLEKIKSLRAPGEIIEYVQQRLSGMLDDLATKRYISNEDDAKHVIAYKTNGV